MRDEAPCISSAERAMSELADGMAGVPSLEGFEDLAAWRKAPVLCREIHEAASTRALAREFAYRNQIQRAAISVTSNIAEGFERGSRAEFFHMLSIARGSCSDVRSSVRVALNSILIHPDTFQKLSARANEVARVVGGLRSAAGRQRDHDRGVRRT